MKNLFLIAAMILILGLNASAQSKGSSSLSQNIKSSPAYAELLLRKTELESEVESLLESYKEDFPKVKESRYELNLIQKDFDKLLAQTDSAKMTLALGKLLTRRADLNTTLWFLQNKYGAEHPEVKRAARKVVSFDNAVKEILP